LQVDTPPQTVQENPMTVELNHIIVPATDKWASARFLADILGVTTGSPLARFAPVPLNNTVTMDYMDIADGPPDGISSPASAPTRGHYAFLVSDDVFDAALARIIAAGIAYHAQPDGTGPGEVYRHDDGRRGLYFPDPDRHLMELLTAPRNAARGPSLPGVE
jgi:catechol 2,3-dioxygenase-like lactoylglutathione lyase family enzyme